MCILMNEVQPDIAKQKVETEQVEKKDVGKVTSSRRSTLSLDFLSSNPFGHQRYRTFNLNVNLN